MRELKFRAWDSLNKRLIYGYFFIDAEGDVWYNQDPNGVDMSGTIKIKPTDKLTIMQFIGIKDSNGIEIYEDDILATSNYDDQFDIWNKEDNGYTQVIWDTVNDCWRGSLWQWSKWDDSVYCFKFIDVVGNIYEHSAKLKLKKNDKRR